MSHCRYIDLFVATQPSCLYCRMLRIQSTLLYTCFSTTDTSSKPDCFFLGADILWLVYWLVYQLDNRGIAVQFLAGARKLDWLWGPPSLCSMGTCGSFSRCEADHSFQLVPRLRMIGAIPPLSHVPSWCVQKQLYCHQILFVNILWLTILFFYLPGETFFEQSQKFRAHKVIAFSIGFEDEIRLSAN
jgi:hypothetical protein